jgi:catechol 2,3-dioxygenase-like lactoylglutathione lyase family enzyme
VAFHHFSSVVADLDRSVAFYSGLLGLEVRSRTRCEMGRLQIAGTGVPWTAEDGEWPTDTVDVVLMELGGVRIEVAQPLDPDRALSLLPLAHEPGARSTHVALKVDDVRALRRSLEAAGVTFVTPLLVFPEEGQRPWIWCRCLDPDGYQVELVEEMPASYQLERMAERLREARAQRGMTLKVVAAQSSMSAAHLSQVERGETVPSVPALLAISSALGVSADYFFRTATDDYQPLTAAGAAAAAGRPGGKGAAPGAAPADAPAVVSADITWQWLTGPGAAVRLARVTFPAGGAAELPGPGSSTMAGGAVSCAVLEGALLAEATGARTVLTPGSSVSYDAAEPYRFINISDAPAVGIWGFHEQ